MSKSADYWEGYNREAARKVRGGAFAQLAERVSQSLGRDNSRKQRIFHRSPHVFAAMDADELSQASSSEMARRELKELGIDSGDNDPVAILDAHHAGRKYARDGGKPLGMEGGRTLAMDSTGSSALDRYLQE